MYVYMPQKSDGSQSTQVVGQSNQLVYAQSNVVRTTGNRPVTQVLTQGNRVIQQRQYVNPGQRGPQTIIRQTNDPNSQGGAFYSLFIKF